MKGTKIPVKVNIDIHIYCKHPIHRNMADVITSGMQSVHTSINNTIHTIKIKIPQFRDRIQSCAYVTIDQSQNPYVKVFIKDIKIENMKIINKDISPPLKQTLAQQLQAIMAVPNSQPRIGIVRPNIQVVIHPSDHSSHISPYIQGEIKNDDRIYGDILDNNEKNVQIQDVRPRQQEQSRLLDTVPKISKQQSIENIDKIIFVSTFDIRCGIATYTMHLMDELNNIYKDSFAVDPTNKGSLNRKISGKLVHIQHEFGIIPAFPKTDSKVIITWHTVPSFIRNTIRQLESKLNIVAHIVHCEGALDYINTKRDVYMINHGSTSIKDVKKEDARKILNINDIYMPIGFVFGFQSPNKLYGELINTAKNASIHIIISGSSHESRYNTNLPGSKNVTFLNRHLTEEEVDLYASASDLLLFDYVSQDHYSCSGAMHRIIGAGRPIICSNTKHFSDVTDKENVLKFNNQKELKQCIKVALEDSTRLGQVARKYAETTSWENIAKRHIEIYRKYVDL